MAAGAADPRACLHEWADGPPYFTGIRAVAAAPNSPLRPDLRNVCAFPQEGRCRVPMAAGAADPRACLLEWADGPPFFTGIRAAADAALRERTSRVYLDRRRR